MSDQSQPQQGSGPEPGDLPVRPEPRAPLSTRLTNAVQRVPITALPVILLCGIIGAVTAPLITINIGQTPIPDGDEPAPILTAVPAALAGFISGTLYAAMQHRQPHVDQGRPAARWRATLLHPAVWGLGTALSAGALASFVILLPITETIAVLGSLTPGHLGIVKTFDQPLRALAGVPPLAWSPLIAAVMRGVSGTRLNARPVEGPAEWLRRAVPLALPLVLATVLTALHF